ncbi:hypothetical protein A6A06_23225 [Streptomyces sp. CB02923]|uniref:hypothetical protein n=1 Tax=Streptomyces sp. CB02923 TaxID=1718985 RepID=UPI00093B8E48|nr:hypothetical protein [Streptomyces sp. CB02923]OKH99946.1 hypothetical protein A6A06_23225 [Streptomyces sp. CB02923]
MPVLVPVLVSLPVLAGPAAAGPTAGLRDSLPAYRTAPGARPVQGTQGPSGAPRIGPGTYTDSLARGDEKFYAVRLDGKSSGYFSAVAAPRPGSEVADHTESLKVSLRDADGNACSPGGSTAFHGRGMAYPIADYATRRADGPRTNCQRAGAYYVVVKRAGRTSAEGAGRWPVELRYQREPGLTGTPPAQPGPGTWSTATPVPLSGGTKKDAKGGTGFNDAGPIGKGVWQDRIRPGETRFYRVPVDWGQQLSVSVELPGGALTGGALSGGDPRAGTARGPGAVAGSRLVASALGLGVYNPARGPVSDTRFIAYDGKPAAARVVTAPVDYGNRYNATAPVSAMRFAGSYYLAVSLHPDAAKYFKDGTPITLRVDPAGRPQRGPDYREKTTDFSVTPQERTASEAGMTTQQVAQSGTLRMVGYGGISTGTVLLLALGVWAVAARWRGGGASRPR